MPSAPAAPRDPRSLRGLCAGLLAGRAVALAAAPAQASSCPRSATSAPTTSTVGAERKLGEQIMREIHRDPDYLDDPVLRRVPAGRSGSRCWPRRARAANSRADLDERFAWQPFLVRDRSVNAFALPGGCRRAPRPDRHHGDARRARLGARRTSCRTSRSATSRACITQQNQQPPLVAWRR